MTDHHQSEKLIPWYVNGTLHENEMATLGAHLEHCPQCRSEVELELEEYLSVI